MNMKKICFTFFVYGGNSIITGTWPDCENTSNNYIDDSDNNLFRFFPNYENDGTWNKNKGMKL